MKAQAREEKLAKQAQREKLQFEIAAQEREEKKQQEYEDRLKGMFFFNNFVFVFMENVILFAK